ncbi:1-phosphofructokinase family hexose kinase [Nocardioides mangrovi]|uniref:PfkB family carbohydrate kinase n=1 Tax=Nocardioides mangrovi TaxID=2874580 RepID=A0ABS7UCK3_9ACTN|nr:PfkB family carbohydrate kinase [Nocardioides mangrovi]MBZ5738723.1 PfkB family carbohydrate kinase [Nocardioides mangrovi]
MIRCVGLSPAVDLTYETSAPLRAGAITRPTAVHRRAGGKAANVARVVAALGGESVLAGIVAGQPGRWLGELARAEGLRTDLVESEHGETRLCTTVLGDPAPTELYEPSGPVDTAAWAELVAHEAAADATWTVVSGSAPPGIGHHDLAVLLAAAARQRPVALDAHGPAVATALASGVPVDLLKVNRHEAAGLLRRPDDTAPEDLATGLASYAGSPVVVVTCGPDGAVAVDRDGVRRVAAGPHGRHPTGSGDAFLGALVLDLAAGHDLDTALVAAAAAGSANAQAPTAGDVSALSL